MASASKGYKINDEIEEFSNSQKNHSDDEEYGNNVMFNYLDEESDDSEESSDLSDYPNKMKL